MVAVIYAIIGAPNHGWLCGMTPATAAAGVAILAAWVVFELCSTHPMVAAGIGVP